MVREIGRSCAGCGAAAFAPCDVSCAYADRMVRAVEDLADFIANIRPFKLLDALLRGEPVRPRK